MPNNKTDSNLTGLAYAEEVALKTLSQDPVWYPFEPNSYSDFGSQVTTVARKPINSSRQQKKGVVTDLDASGGFNQDLTFSNLTRVLQGFFFADIREKVTTAPMNGARIGVHVTSPEVTLDANPGFAQNDIVLLKNFFNTANNGAHTLTKVDGNTLTLSGALVNEDGSPGTVQKVGVAAGGNLAQSGAYFTFASDGVDWTKHNLIPGEFVFLAPVGFARINSVSAETLTFDKVLSQNTGAGITAVYFGDVIKNEDNPSLIKRRTYNIERSLGADSDGQMGEYLVGAVPNEFTLNFSQADKVTADLTFVALDNEQRSGSQGLKGGTRLTNIAEDAFNTSTDISHIILHTVDPNSAIPQELFAFATDAKIVINNGVTVNKAIGVLGGFDASAGTFAISGTETVYFGSVQAVQSIRNNADVAKTLVMQKSNQGLLFDIPLLSLGDGRLSVEADKPITLPLSLSAAESKFNHTLLYQSFAYLPS